MIFAVCVATAIASPAQTDCSVASPCFQSLVSFNAVDGAGPLGALVQGRDGDLYGTAQQAGLGSSGTVFKMTPAGTLTTLYSFCSKVNCADGNRPDAGLVLATNGNFYGTTLNGGANDTTICSLFGYGFVGCGTVFEITPGGTLTALYSFCSESSPEFPYCTDGFLPFAGLVQGTDGNFYGTTSYGGANNAGTVFKITPSGTLTTLHSFGSDTTDGYNPTAGMVQGTDGNFYGTVSAGGTNGYGTVFKITSGGSLTTLHSFEYTDGAYPEAALVQGSDGNFYGTTEEGGANGIWGTVFKITPAGTLTTLYSFCSKDSCTDGFSPNAALVQGTDGNFYGTTTQSGGANYGGTVFKITPGGTLTTLYSFDDPDGAFPYAAPVQHTNGGFYGVTYEGGSDTGCPDCGTAFSLSVGLGPFVEALTYSGKVGNTIEFLGQGFTSSSTVSFNGIKSNMVTVKSSTYLTATVPNGAITGPVTVTTSGLTLKSNKRFRVIPQIKSFSPTSDAIGTVVTIDGESFTGATSVTFGGAKATSFTVDSYANMKVTVPTGAKTGKITVSTPGGTATSSETFTVTPFGTS